MLLRIWLAVAAAAMLLTLCWLFVEKRLFFTTGFAGAAWSWLATTAGDLEIRSLEAGTSVPVEIPSLQWMLLGMAALSFLAAVLHYFDAYPPREDTLSEAQPK